MRSRLSASAEQWHPTVIAEQSGTTRSRTLAGVELKHHLLLFCLPTSLWTFYLLFGLPSEYFQSWPSLQTLILVDIVPTILLVPLSYWLLKHVIGHSFMRAALLASLYASLPLLVYDCIYIGIHLGRGINFFAEYWYLTAFYFVPWIVIPAVGTILSRHIPVPVDEF